jgi:hypothetical protein
MEKRVLRCYFEWTAPQAVALHSPGQTEPGQEDQNMQSLCEDMRASLISTDNWLTRFRRCTPTPVMSVQDPRYVQI